jgi:hypothetical protein
MSQQGKRCPNRGKDVPNRKKMSQSGKRCPKQEKDVPNGKKMSQTTKCKKAKRFQTPAPPNNSLRGIRVLFQTCIPDDVQHRVLAHKVSGPEGEEVGGPGIVHQQLNDPGSHPPVSLVYQMISVTYKKKLLK